MHLSLGKHLVQAGKGLRSAGEDDETADGTIEAMGDAEEDGSRLVIFFFQIVFHQLRERPIASLVALDDLAALFVDDDDVIILVENCHCFWLLANS